MTEVAFHFNAPDKQNYACRLLRKGYLKGARLVVLVEAQALAALDTALWTFSPGEFLPHSREGDAAHVHQHAPIQLFNELPAAVNGSDQAVLVNLRAAMPEGYERYARVIEVVTADPDDRLRARERWRQYRQQGIEPLRHDLQLVPSD